MLYLFILITLFSFSSNHAMERAKSLAKIGAKRIENAALKKFKDITKSATKGTGLKGKIEGARAQRAGLSRWKKAKKALKGMVKKEG